MHKWRKYTDMQTNDKHPARNRGELWAERAGGQRTKDSSISTLSPAQAGNGTEWFITSLFGCLKYLIIFKMLNVLAQKYAKIPTPELGTHTVRLVFIVIVYCLTYIHISTYIYIQYVCLLHLQFTVYTHSLAYRRAWVSLRPHLQVDAAGKPGGCSGEPTLGTRAFVYSAHTPASSRRFQRRYTPSGPAAMRFMADTTVPNPPLKFLILE